MAPDCIAAPVRNCRRCLTCHPRPRPGIIVMADPDRSSPAVRVQNSPFCTPHRHFEVSGAQIDCFLHPGCTVLSHFEKGLTEKWHKKPVEMLTSLPNRPETGQLQGRLTIRGPRKAIICKPVYHIKALQQILRNDLNQKAPD